MTPSKDPSLQKVPANEYQEVDFEKEDAKFTKCPNGSAQTEGGEAPASGGDSDSGKQTLGLEGEGVCEGKCEDCVAVSSVSCGEQQQEEVDSEPRVIREVCRTQTSRVVSETKTYNKLQSGNTKEGTMGQTQGLLPEKEERNKAGGDLPEEREGERNFRQGTSLSSGNTQPFDEQTNSERRSRFYLNLDANVSEKGKEIWEPGSSNEQIDKSTSCTEQDQVISEDLDSLSFRPHMAPGPVHNVHLEPSPVEEHTPDAASGDQCDAPAETTSSCSERVSSDPVKDPLPCDDLTDAPIQPERSVSEISLMTEESGGDVRVVHTLLPKAEEGSSPESERDIQPDISPETSDETSQILNKFHYVAEEPSQEHSELQSDARQMQIMGLIEIMGQSQPLVLDQMLAVPVGSAVSDSTSEETGSGLESKLEKDSLAFQTPPESPCEYFSVDGFIRTNDYIDATCSASLELGLPTHLRKTKEEGEKVETELLQMSESSKKSPVTILCGSFSKLTLRGSPLDPQLDSTTLQTTETITTNAPAGGLQTSKPPSEMEETKEEVIELEPKLVETCERSEALQMASKMTTEPLCDSVCKEKLGGTVMNTDTVGFKTPNDQSPDSMDVQVEWMKMPSQLNENPEISPTLSLSPSVSKNITEPHSEVITFAEGSNKTFEDPQTEHTTSTEQSVETSLDVHLDVSNSEENIGEQVEVITFEENIRMTSSDLHHDLIKSPEEPIKETFLDSLHEDKILEEIIQDQELQVMMSEEYVRGTSLGHSPSFTSSVETFGEGSLGPFPEVKIFGERIPDQQLQMMISEESIRGTSLGPDHDFTSSMETIGEASIGPPPDVNSPEKNVQVQHHKKTRNDVHDPKHGVTTFEDNFNDLNLDLMTPSEETISVTSLGLLLKDNTSEKETAHQHLEVMAPEESIRGASHGPTHDVNLSSGEIIDITSLGCCPEVERCEDNVLDQQPEDTTCEKKKDATSHDSGSNLEVIIVETAPKQQSETTGFEKTIRETPTHTQLEEKACVETFLVTPPEVISSEMDIHLPGAPVQSVSVTLDSPISCSDACLALENVSTSGSLGVSELPVDLSSVTDLDGGTGLDTDSSSSVDVASGLIQDMASLDDVCTSGRLDEEKRQMEEEEHRDDLAEEQVAGEKRLNVILLSYRVAFIRRSPWCLGTDRGYTVISSLSAGLNVSITSIHLLLNAVASQNSSPPCCLKQSSLFDLAMSCYHARSEAAVKNSVCLFFIYFYFQSSVLRDP